MKAKIVSLGNSLAVRIPKTVMKEARLEEADYLEIEASDGRIELRRVSGAKSLTLAELVKQITPENRYAEVSSGSVVANEEVEW